MATILRSSRYIRCLNAFTQRIVASHDNGNFTSKCLKLQVQCINSSFTKSYATAPALERNDYSHNFDKYFTKLDENVQRFGRVFKAEIDEVLSKVRETGYIPSLDGVLLIRCCGDLLVDTTLATRKQLVQDIWNTLETLKIPMDVSHFNALLRVYLENGDEFSPIEILTNMKDKGIEPNRVTYQRLILYNCKKGNIEGATKILEFMKEKDIPLNENVFNALITGHSEANDMESATNILNVMKDAGVVPCSSTYTALLSAYAKRGDMDSIKKIIDECGKKNLYLYDKEFFEVINVLAANGYKNEIDKMLSLMPKGPSYNTDACHAILKILDGDNVDVALKILTTMNPRRNFNEESDDQDNGIFLIRKIVNTQYPIEKIVHTCEYLEQQGLHSRAFVVALERCLLNNDTTLSIPMLKICKERGTTIREHYVWPLFVAHGKASNYQGIEDVLEFLTTSLEIVPGSETIADYVLPYAIGKWDDIVNALQKYKIPHQTIVNAIARRMLMDNKIRKTATFMMNYPANYEPDNFYRPLIDALNYTDDVASFTLILRLLHVSAMNLSNNNTEIAANVIDTVMRRIIAHFPSRKFEIVNEICDRLIENGMSISPSRGEQLREQFKNKITPEIDEKINKLTSGTLVMVPISELETFHKPNDTDEINGGTQMSHMVPNSKYSVLRQQLASCIQARDAKGVTAITAQLESQNFIFSPAVCAQLIDIFCINGDLEQAEKWMTKCKLENPGIELDFQKSTSYAGLLIKNGRFDDALKFILDSPRKTTLEMLGSGQKRLAKMLLDIVAETGDAKRTNELLDALVSSNYAIIDKNLMGPLVRVHLVNDDLDEALNVLENVCRVHRCTPFKNELSKRFINNEDANSLQRLTDLSTQIHGESNSLVDLVLSFIECGRLRQARRILETPGLRLRTTKLKSSVEHYFDGGNIKYLEQFLEITKGLMILERHEMYDVLLETYSKKNDWQRGLNLWTEMQDQDIQPSIVFMSTLAALLKKNNKSVPFRYDEGIRTIAVDSSEKIKATNFYNAINRGNLDEAEEILKDIPGHDEEYSTATSKLIEEILIKQNDVDKALNIIKDLILKHKRLPRTRAFKAVWNALIEAEKYDELKKFDQLLSLNAKKRYRFQKYLNRMNLKRMGLERFLNDFESQITDSPTNNLEVVNNTLHFTSLIEEFEKNPSALSKFQPLAEKLAHQDIHLPINLVWCYYFQANKPEADEIWSKHLVNSKWIVFGHLINVCKKTNNVHLLERLHQKVQENRIISGNAMSTIDFALVEVYTKSERYDDALNVLKSVSLDGIQRLTQMDLTNIGQLKRGLEANGKSLPSHFEVSRLLERQQNAEYQ